MGIDTKSLRKAQLIMLEMLVEFHAICEVHNLQYWLDSGTLLGAVRHQGFIPWDDDIDISMPLEDYEAFLKIAPTKLSSNIFLQHKKTDAKIPFDYAKLRSNRAEMIEFHEIDKEVTYHQGVFLDIFPMLYIKHTRLHHYYYKTTFTLIRFFSEKNLHIETSIPNETLRRFLIWTLKKMHNKHAYTHRQVIYSGEMPDVAAWFDKKEIFPLKKIKFEKLYFNAPHNQEHYLRAIYTFNFRELPPENMRTVHAHKVIFHS